MATFEASHTHASSTSLSVYSEDRRHRLSSCYTLELDSRATSIWDDDREPVDVDATHDELELSSRGSSVVSALMGEHGGEEADVDQSNMVDNVQHFNEFKLSLVQLYGNGARSFFEHEAEYLTAKLDDAMIMGLTNAVMKEIDKKLREYISTLPEYGQMASLPLSSSPGDDDDEETSRLSQSSVWNVASRDWVTARRDSLIAAKTYDETLKSIAFETQKGFLQEQQLMEEVKIKDKEYTLIYCCEKDTGLIGSEALARAKAALRQAESVLQAVRAQNEKFKQESFELEKALGKLKIQKENAYVKLLLSNEERNLADIREEAQELRKAAYTASRLVNILHDNAKKSPDTEAIMLWDDVILKARDAEFAWFRTMNGYRCGISKVPPTNKDWWERAIQTAKNSIQVKRMEIKWYEARKAECIGRLSVVALSYAQHSNGMWDDALEKSAHVSELWNAATMFCRKALEDIHEVFQDWWENKLHIAEELQLGWANVYESLTSSRTDVLDVDDEDDGGAVTMDAIVSPSHPPVAASSSSAASAATVGGASGMPFHHTNVFEGLIASMESLKVFASTAGDDYAVDTRSRERPSNPMQHKLSRESRITTSGSFTSLSSRMTASASFSSSPLHSTPPSKKEQKAPGSLPTSPSHESTFTFGDAMEEINVRRIAAEAELSRKRLRHESQGNMSAAMCARQEETIRVCFEDANMAKAKLLHSWKEPKGTTLIPGTWLSRVASAFSVNKVAENRYSATVKLEALEDSRKKPELSLQLKEDWQNRIAADRNVVTQTRALRNEARSCKDVALKLRAQRDHLRAKAILDADVAAYNAAWPS